MSQEILLGVISAVAFVLSAILGGPRLGRDARSTIAKDLEIYKALPESSTVKLDFLKYIERRVRQLFVDQSEDETSAQGTRSGGQIALGITILIMAAALGLLVVLGGSWWWIASPAVIFLLLLGGVGFGQGLKKGPRDEKGNLVK